MGTNCQTCGGASDGQDNALDIEARLLEEKRVAEQEEKDRLARLEILATNIHRHAQRPTHCSTVGRPSLFEPSLRSR